MRTIAMMPIAAVFQVGTSHLTQRGTCIAMSLLLLIGTLTITASDETCGFLDNMSICDVIVASLYPTHIQATINQCSKPVDVTFHIKVINTTWSFSHTFANRDEIQHLHGLGSDAFLQVALQFQQPRHLHVYASFDVASRPVQVIMNDMVVIHGMERCTKHTNPNAYLPLIIFIILIILIVALMGTILGFRRHHTHKRHGDLLSNMEPASHTSYCDDPTMISHTTVIKNDIYCDTVTAITERDAANGRNGNYSGGVGTVGLTLNGDEVVSGEFQIRPPQVQPISGAKRKRMLKISGLPQPVLERLPEEPGEEDVSSSSLELDVASTSEGSGGVNPSVNVVT